MQQTTNLELNKFDLSDNMKTTTRQGLNENADILDGAIGDLSDLTTTHKDSLVNAINDAAENGGIAVQDTAPTNDVLAWVDSDALGADFCFVGDTAPATDGTVAVWVDTSEDEIPVEPLDYIVEQGTSDIWTYRKWNSGIAECWGIAHFTNVACTTAWGSIFQSSYFGNTAFPFEFTTAPTLTVHLSAMSTSDYSCWALVNGSNPTSKSQTGAVIIARGSSATVPNVYVNFHAIGTWK